MRTCVWCLEEIAPGERCWRFANGPLAHRTCALRQVVGSVAHVERRCGCYVASAREGDPEGLTRREAAEAAVQAWRRREEAHMPDVPLRLQLACARRELARRACLYPRLVEGGVMLQSTATHELKAMEAVVRTLARLVAAEAGDGGQAELCDARGGGEAEP